MKQILLLGFLLLVVLGKKELTDFPMIDGIVQVSDDNIDDILDTTYEIMLMFCNGYMDVCLDHREPYVRAAKFLSKLEKPVYLGEVDIEMNSQLEERYNITSYPTYMMIYSFGRDPEKLKLAQTDITFAKEAMRRNYVDLIEVKTPEEWEEYKTMLSITTLAVFETKECEQYETYEKLAMGKSNAVFFWTTNLEIVHTSDAAALYSFHHSDGNTLIHFTGDMTNFNQMSDFIDMNELPLVIDYKDKVTAREIFESKRITNQLILFYNASEPGFDDALNEFYLVAKETLGRTYCLKATIEDNARLMRHFGVQWTPARSFIVHNNKMENGLPRKYLFSGELVSEDILRFLEKALRFDNSLMRLYVSERVPEPIDNHSNCNKTVQQTWERDVLNPSKDVMVLYEAARCKECIQAELYFFSFAEDYEEVEDLAFYQAFIDRNEFTHKSTKIANFPAIRFYPRTENGEKKTKWVNFHEEMSIEGMERFLRKYATVELPEPEDDEDL